MGNNGQLDSLAQAAAAAAQPDSLMELMRGLEGSLPWILVLVVSIAVMQLVTVVVLARGRKGAHGYRGHDRDRDRRPVAPAGADGKSDRSQGGAPRRADWSGGQKKPGDNRGGRPQQGQGGDRPRQGQGGRPGQSVVNQVELSLRDINQRLKNAEREQDNARRSIRDVDGADGDGRDRDGRQQRGGRDGGNRDGGRNDRGPRRDGNRDNRNRDGGRPERQNDGGRPPRERGQFRQDDAGHGSATQERPTAPEIAQNDVGMPEDQLQHGRRFAAKRRILPDATGGTDGAAAIGGNEPPEQNQATIFDNISNTPPETPAIGFGEQEQPETQGQIGNDGIQFGR